MSFFDKLIRYFDLQRDNRPQVEEAPVVTEPEPEPSQAEFSLVNGKLVIKKYNIAFVTELRQKLGDLSDGKTDSEIVELYLSRENLEREEPKLDVQHFGMDEAGAVKMKLDWNRAFINHLRENGITGETEEEAVEMYLQLLHQLLYQL